MTTRTTRSSPTTAYSRRNSSHYWLLGNNGDYITNNGDYIGVRFEVADQDREEDIVTAWGNRSVPSTTWGSRSAPSTTRGNRTPPTTTWTTR